ISMYSNTFGDMLFETIVPTVFTYFLMANYYAYRISWILLVVIYAIVFVILFVTFGILQPAVRRAEDRVRKYREKQQRWLSTRRTRKRTSMNYMVHRARLSFYEYV